MRTMNVQSAYTLQDKPVHILTGNACAYDIRIAGDNWYQGFTRNPDTIPGSKSCEEGWKD